MRLLLGTPDACPASGCHHYRPHVGRAVQVVGELMVGGAARIKGRRVLIMSLVGQPAVCMSATGALGACILLY